MKRILAQAGFALLALSVPVLASAQSQIEGRWRSAKGNLVVRVEPCGRGWCGTVVNASEKAKAGARKGGTDQLIGTRILTGVRPAGEATYRGQAFDPKRNIRVPATIRVLGPSTLLVKGCVIGGLLCKEQRWTRVS